MNVPSFPSPTKIKSFISQWEKLLQCSQCGTVVDSLADLFDGKLCVSCCGCSDGGGAGGCGNRITSLSVLVNGGRQEDGLSLGAPADPGRVLNILKLILERSQTESSSLPPHHHTTLAKPASRSPSVQDQDQQSPHFLAEELLATPKLTKICLNGSSGQQTASKSREIQGSPTATVSEANLSDSQTLSHNVTTRNTTPLMMEQEEEETDLAFIPRRETCELPPPDANANAINSTGSKSTFCTSLGMGIDPVQQTANGHVSSRHKVPTDDSTRNSYVLNEEMDVMFPQTHRTDTGIRESISRSSALTQAVELRSGSDLTHPYRDDTKSINSEQCVGDKGAANSNSIESVAKSSDLTISSKRRTEGRFETIGKMEGAANDREDNRANDDTGTASVLLRRGSEDFTKSPLHVERNVPRAATDHVDRDSNEFEKLDKTEIQTRLADPAPTKVGEQDVFASVTLTALPQTLHSGGKNYDTQGEDQPQDAAHSIDTTKPHLQEVHHDESGLTIDILAGSTEGELNQALSVGGDMAVETPGQSLDATVASSALPQTNDFAPALEYDTIGGVLQHTMQNSTSLGSECKESDITKLGESLNESVATNALPQTDDFQLRCSPQVECLARGTISHPHQQQVADVENATRVEKGGTLDNCTHTYNEDSNGGKSIDPIAMSHTMDFDTLDAKHSAANRAVSSTDTSVVVETTSGHNKEQRMQERGQRPTQYDHEPIDQSTATRRLSQTSDVCAPNNVCESTNGPPIRTQATNSQIKAAEASPACRPLESGYDSKNESIDTNALPRTEDLFCVSRVQAVRDKGSLDLLKSPDSLVQHPASQKEKSQSDGCSQLAPAVDMSTHGEPSRLGCPGENGSKKIQTFHPCSNVAPAASDGAHDRRDPDVSRYDKKSHWNQSEAVFDALSPLTESCRPDSRTNSELASVPSAKPYIASCAHISEYSGPVDAISPALSASVRSKNPNVEVGEGATMADCTSTSPRARESVVNIHAPESGSAILRGGKIVHGSATTITPAKRRKPEDCEVSSLKPPNREENLNQLGGVQHHASSSEKPLVTPLTKSNIEKVVHCKTPSFIEISADSGSPMHKASPTSSDNFTIRSNESTEGLGVINVVIGDREISSQERDLTVETSCLRRPAGGPAKHRKRIHVLADVLVATDYARLQSLNNVNSLNLLKGNMIDGPWGPNSRLGNSGSSRKGNVSALAVHVESKPNPLGKFDPENVLSKSVVKVCFRTFNYLKARALGFAVTSVNNLDILSRAESLPRGDYSDVWGDSTLYEQLLDGNNDYGWLRNTHWWHAPSERDQGIDRLLAGFNILLPNSGCTVGGRDKKRPIDHVVASMPTAVDCMREDALVSECSNCFNGLSDNEAKILCELTGATIVHSSCDPTLNYLVLTNDLVDEEELRETIIPNLVRTKTIPSVGRLHLNCSSGGFQTSQVKFVYYSWLADSISANCVAPLSQYSVGFLE